MARLLQWMVLSAFAILSVAIPFPTAHANAEQTPSTVVAIQDEEVNQNAVATRIVYPYDGIAEDSEGAGDQRLGSTSDLQCKCPKRHPRGHHRRRHHPRSAYTRRDVDELNVVLNAEYLEAEFFLNAAYGYGLDKFNGTAVNISGPSPIGAQKARMGKFVEHMAKEFGLQSLGHIRELHADLGEKAISRPQIDISRHNWGGVFNEAFGTKLRPSFNPYSSGNAFLLAAYMLPYVSYTAYVGINEHVEGVRARSLVAGLVGVKAAEDSAIRTVLYQRRRQAVPHYNMTVGDFTKVLSAMRSKLDRANVTVLDPVTGEVTLPPTVDEGVLVSGDETPEHMLTGNIISVDTNSLSVGRTPEQMLQVLYGTGNASIPGLFFPKGANGRFATTLLAAGLTSQPLLH